MATYVLAVEPVHACSFSVTVPHPAFAAVVLAVAVVVIAGLVGSGALGYAVAAGLQRGQFGLGVVASIAILAMGIALDRVTRGNRSAAKGGRS